VRRDVRRSPPLLPFLSKRAPPHPPSSPAPAHAAAQERAHGESSTLPEECTFKPKISAKARTIASGAQPVSEEQALAVLLRAVQSRHGSHRLIDELMLLDIDGTGFVKADHFDALIYESGWALPPAAMDHLHAQLSVSYAVAMHDLRLGAPPAGQEVEDERDLYIECVRGGSGGSACGCGGIARLRALSHTQPRARARYATPRSLPQVRPPRRRRHRDARRVPCDQ
jgi:hypothetical protein